MAVQPERESPRYPRPRAGQVVYSFSMRPIGEVMGTREGAFHVRTADRDLWLKSYAVYAISSDRVQLECEPSSLDRYTDVAEDAPSEPARRTNAG